MLAGKLGADDGRAAELVKLVVHELVQDHVSNIRRLRVNTTQRNARVRASFRAAVCCV